jgi:hypothetical protein
MQNRKPGFAFKKIIERFTKRRELRRKLQTVRLVVFSLRTDYFFKKKEDSLDAQYLSFLESKLYKMEVNVSDQTKEKARSIMGIITTSFEMVKKAIEGRKTDFHRETLIQDIIKQKESVKSSEKFASTKEKVLDYMRLYNEALENLVEGQREVLQNENFVMEDGKTVKEKENQLEEILSKMKNQAESNLK